jgi:hypothetical protein
MRQTIEKFSPEEIEVILYMFNVCFLAKPQIEPETLPAVKYDFLIDRVVRGREFLKNPNLELYKSICLKLNIPYEDRLVESGSGTIPSEGGSNSGEAVLPNPAEPHRSEVDAGQPAS